jgi:glycolate oxidase
VLDDAITVDLRRLLGAESVLTDEASLVAAGTDFVSSRGVFGAVVRATSADQVAALLAYADERGLPVAPRAAATALSGGFVADPGAVALDLAGMNRVLEIDAAAGRAVVEPGVINGHLQAQVTPLGLCFSPDPASREISSIGGNICENSGGPACIKYGVTFHHVVAVDLVMAGGRVVTLSEDDDCDLLGLVIGSEGTLGIVTRAVVRLRPLPGARWTALAAFGRVEEAAETVSAIIAAGLLPAALEFCDARQVELCEAWTPSGYPLDAGAILFAELDGSAAEVAEAAPLLEAVLRRFDPSVRVAAGPEERARLWAGRLGAMLAYQASGKQFYICDVSVPRHRLPEMIGRARAIAARLGLDVATVGHAGDGNLHPVILYTVGEEVAMTEGAAAIAAAALELGGTLTGEHGIGTRKLDQMRARFSAAEVAAFRAIKRAFDPNEVLNPGVMLPPEATDEPLLPRFSAAVSAAVAAAGAGPAAAEGEPGHAARDDDQIRVDVENLTLEAGSGAGVRDVRAALDAVGLHSPVFEAEGTVGDLVDVAGNRGSARAALLAIEGTLHDGPRVRFGSAAVKDVAGLDAKRLLAGGRGGYGRVERATFRVVPGRSA